MKNNSHQTMPKKRKRQLSYRKPTTSFLKKYEAAVKEKMLMKLEKNRFVATVDNL